jgi:hypothetical protein
MAVTTNVGPDFSGPFPGAELPRTHNSKSGHKTSLGLVIMILYNKSYHCSGRPSEPLHCYMSASTLLHHVTTTNNPKPDRPEPSE